MSYNGRLDKVNKDVKYYYFSNEDKIEEMINSNYFGFDALQFKLKDKIFLSGIDGYTIVSAKIYQPEIEAWK